VRCWLGWRERLSRELREALVLLSEAHAELGQDDRSILAARRALALEPWEEKAHRLVMQGLALKSALGAQAFTKAWAEGQAMTLEKAAEYVMKGMEISG
jgi:hypothetical protein